MAEIPACPDCHLNDKQRIMDDATEHWTFGCLRCNGIWIVSKPHTKARTAVELAAKRYREISEAERAHMARPKHFDFGRSRA